MKDESLEVYDIDCTVSRHRSAYGHPEGYYLRIPERFRLQVYHDPQLAVIVAPAAGKESDRLIVTADIDINDNPEYATNPVNFFHDLVVEKGLDFLDFVGFISWHRSSSGNRLYIPKGTARLKEGKRRAAIVSLPKGITGIAIEVIS